MRRISYWWFLGLAWCSSVVCARDLTAEERIGRRLFNEPRFAEFFFAHCHGDVNAALAEADPALTAAHAPGPTVSCRSCHFSTERQGGAGLPTGGIRAFADFAVRSPVPARNDRRATTPRNAPALVGLIPPGGPAPSLLHYDGEFSNLEELIAGTYLGRNFGWLPGEQAEARRHFARVIRMDDGKGEFADETAHLSYATLLRGTDKNIPFALRLPLSLRLDPATASDEEVLQGCVRLVELYLESQQFSHGAEARYTGSPYDAFLAANRLPVRPHAGETPHEYTRRLREAVAAMKAPKFVDDPSRRLTQHHEDFRFGETELRGLKIFLRSALGPA